MSAPVHPIERFAGFNASGYVIDNATFVHLSGLLARFPRRAPRGVWSRLAAEMGPSAPSAEDVARAWAAWEEAPAQDPHRGLFRRAYLVALKSAGMAALVRVAASPVAEARHQPRGSDLTNPEHQMARALRADGTTLAYLMPLSAGDVEGDEATRMEELR